MAKYIVHKAIELAKLSKARAAAVTKRIGIISPKYDGCHAIFLWDNGIFHGAWSRTHEPIRSVAHIADDLVKVYPWLAEGNHAICGEVWIPKTDFEVISGLFRRHAPERSLRFVPFDHVHWVDNCGIPVLCSTAPYRSRIKLLADNDNDSLSVELVSYFLGTYEQAVTDAVTLKRHGGYDGVVFADAEGIYEVGAGKGGEFVKVKPLFSESVIVTGVELERGEKTGKNTMALTFNLDGMQQRVSTGLLQADIDSYATDSSLIVGKHIEVEAMGKWASGMLREPRYKGIRTDVI